MWTSRRRSTSSPKRLNGKCTNISESNSLNGLSVNFGGSNVVFLEEFDDDQCNCNFSAHLVRILGVFSRRPKIAKAHLVAEEAIGLIKSFKICPYPRSLTRKICSLEVLLFKLDRNKQQIVSLTKNRTVGYMTRQNRLVTSDVSAAFS